MWFVLSFILFNVVQHELSGSDTETLMPEPIAFLAVQLIFFMFSVHGYLRSRDHIGLGKSA